MRINWFPGHMNKARREIRATLARTDVVLEVLDARLPRASQNPMLSSLRGDKPCVRVLSRADLADPEVTAIWLEELRASGTAAVAIDAHDQKAAQKVLSVAKKLTTGRIKSGRGTYALVVGIPNVGKSTLLNSLAKRKVAEVRDQPAVTKRQQTREIAPDVFVLDTPGVLWPKLEDQRAALRLALSGAVKEAILELRTVAEFGLGLLAERYPGALEARYRLSPGLPEHELLVELGRKRGFLLRGGEVDLDKAAGTFIRELRSGKLGRISYELPGDWEPAVEEQPDDPEPGIIEP